MALCHPAAGRQLLCPLAKKVSSWEEDAGGGDVVMWAVVVAGHSQLAAREKQCQAVEN